LGRATAGFSAPILSYERGVPSHDTLNDLVNALDPQVFGACFIAWVAGLREDEPI